MDEMKKKALASHTIAELRQKARDGGVNLHGATTKSEILRHLQNSARKEKRNIRGGGDDIDKLFGDVDDDDDTVPIGHTAASRAGARKEAVYEIGSVSVTEGEIAAAISAAKLFTDEEEGEEAPDVKCLRNDTSKSNLEFKSGVQSLEAAIEELQKYFKRHVSRGNDDMLSGVNGAFSVWVKQDGRSLKHKGLSELAAQIAEATKDRGINYGGGYRPRGSHRRG